MKFRWVHVPSRRILASLPALVAVALFAVFALITARQVRQDGLNSDLIAAINGIDRTTAITLLRQGADPDSRSQGYKADETSFWAMLTRWFERRPSRTTLGPCALQLAMNQGDLKLVAALLSHKANPNVTDEGGTSLLVQSMYRDDGSTARLLLNAGASDVNGKYSGALHGTSLIPVPWDYQNESILFWAVKAGHLDLVKSLLDRGAEINAADDNGRTALMWAAHECKPSVTRLLLERGATVMQTDCDGHTALWIARKARTPRTLFGQNEESAAVLALLKRAGEKE